MGTIKAAIEDQIIQRPWVHIGGSIFLGFIVGLLVGAA